jgi:hypothetical protein
MNIEYTYTITRVDSSLKTMEVVYSSEGRQTMHVGARLPYEGESLETIIDMHAPVAFWREQTKNVVVPEVGLQGTILNEAPKPITELEEQINVNNNAEMWEYLKFEKDVAKALVKFGVLQEDPTVIPTAEL